MIALVNPNLSYIITCIFKLQVLVVKTGEDILLIMADTKLAESLGLRRMDQSLHCIILSKKSKLIRGKSVV